MENLNLRNDHLFGLAYVEATLQSDWPMIDEMAEVMSDVELIRGLLLTSSVAILALSQAWGVTEVEVIEKLRQTALKAPSPDTPNS